jgi:hypothetical protein
VSIDEESKQWEVIMRQEREWRNAQAAERMSLLEKEQKALEVKNNNIRLNRMNLPVCNAGFPSQF